MRLLYLTDRLSHRGGAPHHLLDVVGTASGEVSIATGQIDKNVDLPDGVAVHRIRGLQDRHDDAGHLDGLVELLESADVVHVQNVMNPAALRAARDCQRAVVTVQDHRIFCPGPGKTMPNGTQCTIQMTHTGCADCLPDPAYRQEMLMRTQARRDAIEGSHIIVLSQYMADELAAAGLPDATVIPPPVRAAAAPSSAGQGFLLAGRLVHHKGVDFAQQAWLNAEVDQPFLVAGAGALSTQLTQATHLGWLQRDELRQQMAQARAVLFPGRWQEPFGIAGVEALAEGTAVVCMNTGGTADWNDAGCVVVPPGDVTGMANAIRHLANHPEVAQQLGHAGWQMVQERFNPEVVTAQIQAIYTKITG